MIKTLKIGEKDVVLKASAATPILYKQAFGEDMIQELNAFTQMKDKLEQAGKMRDLTSKLAFIMNKEATTSEDEIFNSLNFQKYVAWMMQFDPNEIETHGAEIITISRGNLKQNAQPKNA